MSAPSDSTDVAISGDGQMWSSDASLARLVRDLADAVIVADHAGTIVFWNAAAERIFGWPPDEAAGKSLDLVIPERLRARHWAGYHETMATGHTDYGDRLLEVPALHRDGRTLSIAFTVTLMQQSAASMPSRPSSATTPNAGRRDGASRPSWRHCAATPAPERTAPSTGVAVVPRGAGAGHKRVSACRRLTQLRVGLAGRDQRRVPQR